MPAQPPTLSRTTLAVRLGVFYAAIFGALGIYLPYFPIWLKARGLSESEIGVVLGLGIWMRVVGSPYAAQAVDRSGRRWLATVLISFAGFVTFALFGLAHTFVAIALVSTAFGLCYPTLMPLADNLAQVAQRTHRINYGRVRLWGSFGFLSIAVLGGIGLEGRSADLVYAWMVVGLGVATFSAIGLPRLDERPSRPDRPPLKRLLTWPRFVLLLVTIGLIQGSHAAYYGFATLHWQAAGIAESTIGCLWAEGVLAEIALFWIGSRLVQRLGIRGMLLLGASAAAVRWFATAATTEVAVLASVQWLHALSFGATHLAAIQFIVERVPAETAATAQSLVSAIASGAGIAIAMMLAGALYEIDGSTAFLAMGGLAIAGLLTSLVR